MQEDQPAMYADDAPSPIPTVSASATASEATSSARAAPIVTPHVPAMPGIRPIAPFDLLGLLKEMETNYIDAALQQTGGNRQAAARLLGLRRTTLVEKLRRRAASERTAHGDDAT
jgi:DNA-binding NtrC family response regulator